MKHIAIAVLLVAVAAAAYWLWIGREHAYDYEAAFENLPVFDPAADLPLGAFAGKPRAEAETVLGRPYGCESALHSERCRYPDGVEVVYIDGLADWITVSFGYGRYALSQDILGHLGLPAAAPDEEGVNHLRWTRIKGLRDVQVVGDENGALFVRVRVKHG